MDSALSQVKWFTVDFLMYEFLFLFLANFFRYLVKITNQKNYVPIDT